MKDNDSLVSGHIPVTIGIESMNVDVGHDDTLQHQLGCIKLFFGAACNDGMGKNWDGILQHVLQLQLMGGEGVEQANRVCVEVLLPWPSRWGMFPEGTRYQKL